MLSRERRSSEGHGTKGKKGRPAKANHPWKRWPKNQPNPLKVKEKAKADFQTQLKKFA